MWLGDVCIIEGLALVAAGSTAAAATLGFAKLECGRFVYFIFCWYLKQLFNFLFSNIDLHGL